MNNIKGNALIGQSGGPTSVINSSLAGVIEAGIKAPFINNVYGMHYGIEGFMKEDIFDLGKQTESVIKGLRRTTIICPGIITPQAEGE
jgi:6-phosphofructokinase